MDLDLFCDILFFLVEVLFKGILFLLIFFVLFFVVLYYYIFKDLGKKELVLIVNFLLWRRDVVIEIYNNVFENKEKLLK